MKTLIRTIPAGTKFECFDAFVGWEELKNSKGKSAWIPFIMFWDETGAFCGTRNIPDSQAIFVGLKLLKYGIKSVFHNRWMRKKVK